jgi:hypothetical protein
MVDRDCVLLAVPVGKENAVGLTRIEEALGLWSSRDVRHYLAELVASGQIQSETVRARGIQDVRVYYRSRVAPSVSR